MRLQVGAELVLAERPWRPTGVLATLNLSRHIRRLTDPKTSGAPDNWGMHTATAFGKLSCKPKAHAQR